MGRRKQPQELQPNVKVVRKDDPIALHHLLKMLLLALEIADMSKEEAEAYQKKVLDNM